MSDSPLSPEAPQPEVVFARPVEMPPGALPGRLPGGAVRARAVSAAQTPASATCLTLPGLPLRAAVVDFLLLLLVAAVALGGPSIVVGTWMAATGRELPDQPTFRMMMSQQLFQVILSIGLLSFLLWRRNLPSCAFGVQAHMPGQQLLWGAAGLGVAYGWMIFSVIVISAVLQLFPGLQSDLTKRQDLIELLPDTLGKVIILMIPVAVSEEILFRGLMLPYLRRITGYWWSAVLISTVIFAVLHFQQNILGILQISGVAVVFALIFIYSRSLLAAIVAHFAFDVGQMLLVMLSKDMLKSYGLE